MAKAVATKRAALVQKQRPIVLGCYTLTEIGIEMTGRPTFEEHADVGEFIRRAQKASGWWLADWLRYGNTRPDWKAQLEHLIDVTHYAEGTIKNYKYLGENVGKVTRRDDVDISLHFVVAPLTPKEQTTWLAKAATEGWTQRDLRRRVKAAARTKLLEGQAPNWHTVDVTVRMTLQAPNGFAAEQIAWDQVKAVIAGMEHTHVIAAHAQPHSGGQPATAAEAPETVEVS